MQEVSLLRGCFKVLYDAKWKTTVGYSIFEKKCHGCSYQGKVVYSFSPKIWAWFQFILNQNEQLRSKIIMKLLKGIKLHGLKSDVYQHKPVCWNRYGHILWYAGLYQKIWSLIWVWLFFPFMDSCVNIILYASRWLICPWSSICIKGQRVIITVCQFLKDNFPLHTYYQQNMSFEKLNLIGM